MKSFSETKNETCMLSYEAQENMRWSPYGFTMKNDITNFNDSNSDVKKLIINVLSYFVQADVEIQETYLMKYPTFFNREEKDPKVAMMMASFANAEANHVRSYAYLITSLNLPVETFNIFQEYEKELKLFEELNNLKADEHIELLSITKAVLFFEGVMIYGMFALLMAFQFDKLFVDLGGIISYSIRDENLHVSSMSHFIRSFAMDKYKIDVPVQYEAPLKSYKDKFLLVEKTWLSMLKSEINVKNLPPHVQETIEKIPEYMEWLANKRIDFILGKENTTKCPLPFMDDLSLYQNQEFLQTRSTEYSRVELDSDMYDEIN